MKLIIAGGRDFDNYNLLGCILEGHIFDHVEVVSGAARGADRLGELWAETNGFNITRFPADWDKIGKTAGFKRNQEMAEYADALVAFPGGNGTDHMVECMKKLGKPCIQITGEW